MMQQFMAVNNRACNYIKQSVFGSFNFFELFGIWHLLPYLGKTFIPKLWKNRVEKKQDKPEKNISLNISDISVETASSSAYQMLTSIGLTKNFAEKVVLCGHKSDSENNPFASSLDCGACGGNSGYINAIVAAKFLNDSRVRKNLKLQQIFIPEKTRFIAACHHTSNDYVEFFEPAHDLADVFAVACKTVSIDQLKNYPMLINSDSRSCDWAELVPEYGLANNAAMIIGSRDLTKHSDLSGRVFLHSYDKVIDTDGVILEGIMSAPMIVAHWINMQYYFSTLYSKQFSAGNKAIHNVIPGIGVMAGNISDLKIGLPEQSVQYRGQLVHQPQRLCVIIDAKYQHIKKIIDKHDKIYQLIRNEWLTVYVISDEKCEPLVIN